MFDDRSLQDYRPPGPHIEAIDGDRLVVFCGDEMPPIGAALAVEVQGQRLWAVVERHVGARRIGAWLPLAPAPLSPRASVTISYQPAAFSLPASAPLVPSPQLIHPAGDAAEDHDHLLWPVAPDWSEIAGRLTPLRIGIEPVDALAPICLGGLNLIIDHSPDGAGFSSLAATVDAALTPTRRLVVAPTPSALMAPADNLWQVDTGRHQASQMAALQIAIGLAPALRQARQALALIALPTLQPFDPISSAPPLEAPTGMPEIIDRLGRHLVSTRESSLTTLFHLHLPDHARGLAHIIETLRLGDVDTTIYIDDKGRFSPRRSTSRASLLDEDLRRQRQGYLTTLQLAHRARQKSAIFGDHDLTQDQRQALQGVSSLRPCLIDGIDDVEEND